MNDGKRVYGLFIISEDDQCDVPMIVGGGCRPEL
jgi:hypothetical protein